MLQIDELIYWIDYGSKRRDTSKISIKRAFTNGTLLDRFLEGTKETTFQPHDLAVDPVSRVLFWTCTETNSLNMTRLDQEQHSNNGNSNLEALIRFGSTIVGGQDGSKPRSIAVHPLKG